MSTVPHLKNLYYEPSNEVFRDLRLCTNPMDSCGITCSTDFLAAPWEVGGGGVIGILNLKDTIRNPPILKLKGHTASILDLSFNPSYHSVIASCSEDLTIRIWDILKSDQFYDISTIADSSYNNNNNMNRCTNNNGDEHTFENGFKTFKRIEKNVDLKECLCILKGHKKKVNFINWNARSPYIIASTGYDSQVNIWDIENEKKAFQLVVPKKLSSLQWNVQGNLLSGICINKNIHIIDPRVNNICNSFKAHTGGRMAKCAWFDGLSGNDNFVLSTGFSKESMRELKLWDLKNTKEPIDAKSLDNSAAPLFPFYDETIGVVYLIGKGDGNCRYYQYFQGVLQKIGEYKSNLPFKSFGFIPKQICDIKRCELGRVYKNENNNSIRPISFCVPRKNVTTFQEDLYPPLITDDFYNGASEWVEGQDTKIRRTSINELTEEQLNPPRQFKDVDATKRGSVVIQESLQEVDKKFFMRQITKTFNFLKKNTEHFNQFDPHKSNEKHGLDELSDDAHNEEYAKVKKEMEFYRNETNKNKELIKKLEQKIKDLEKQLAYNGAEGISETATRDSKFDNEVIDEMNGNYRILRTIYQQNHFEQSNKNEDGPKKYDHNTLNASDMHEDELEKSTKHSSSGSKNLQQDKKIKCKINNFFNNMKNMKLFTKNRKDTSHQRTNEIDKSANGNEMNEPINISVICPVN